MTPQPSTQADAEATVLVAGAGSAGHVSPMLAVARALTERYEGVRVVALGTKVGLEADLVPAAGFELLTIEKVPFPRRPNAAALQFPREFGRGLGDVRRFIRTEHVDAIAGFGGYVCPPAYLAGRHAKLPLVVHEANKRPGMANRLGVRLGARAMTAFDMSGTSGPFSQAEWVGMPKRPEIAHLDREAKRAEARESFGLDPDKPTLLVTGGSLGAQRLNETLIAAMGPLEGLGVQILHVTGKGKQIPTRGKHYVQVEYVDGMEGAYAAADFAVTRSGAGTVCELAAVGLPALFVPLPIGNGEQALNGADMVAAGGARMIKDALLTPELLVETVGECLLDTEVRGRMEKAALALGKRDAAEKVADRIAATIPALATQRPKGGAR